MFHIDLHQQGNIVAESIAVLRVAGIHPPAIPSRRDGSSQCILSFQQQMRHIVCLVLQTFVVAGPAGRQLVVPHFLSIDESLVQSVRGDIQGRLFHFLPDGFRLPEAGRKDGVRCRNPSGFPITCPDTRLPSGNRFFGHVPMIVPHLKRPGIFGIGHQFSSVGNTCRAVRFHLSAIPYFLSSGTDHHPVCTLNGSRLIGSEYPAEGRRAVRVYSQRTIQSVDTHGGYMNTLCRYPQR